MDGPAHLYNSNIVLNLIKGNNAISEFYSFNNLPIPNWTSHFILTVLMSFLKPWLAEKILITLYVTGMALSFRYFVNTLNPQNISLSILIFPFIYSFLFHLGFYNFSISFVLFFLTFSYWLNIYNSKNPWKFLLLFILFAFTYFSNLLIFGFLTLVIVLYIIYFSYEKFLESKDLNMSIKFFYRKLLTLIILALPYFVLLLIFSLNVKFYALEGGYSFKELFKWINDARPFIVYDYLGEEIITEQYFHILIILLILSFVINFKEAKNNNIKYNILLIPLTIILLLYITTPNNSGAGMMSYRYCLILFMFGISWIVLRAVNIKFNYFLIIIMLFLHFIMLFKQLNGTLKQLDKDAIVIKQADKYIRENSIVLPINLSDNWLEIHFSNYLGVEKPMIILENYEANVNWFPVRWRRQDFPNVLLEDRNVLSGIGWPNNKESIIKRQIDYVVLYGNLEKLNNAEYAELKELLSTKFKLKYKSENSYLIIFERQT